MPKRHRQTRPRTLLQAVWISALRPLIHARPCLGLDPATQALDLAHELVTLVPLHFVDDPLIALDLFLHWRQVGRRIGAEKHHAERDRRNDVPPRRALALAE